MDSDQGKWHKLRNAASVISDLWDAAKFLALCVTAIVVAVVATAAFAWTSMPPGFLALFLFGVAGLVSVGAYLSVRRFLPTPQPKPASPVASPNPNSTAALLQRQHDEAQQEAQAQERKREERVAIRLVREELRDNRDFIGTLRGPQNKAWNANEQVLLERDDPSLHEVVSDAYRKLVVHQATFAVLTTARSFASSTL